ncbi:sorbosone dehydrogenase family protein [Mucilaginibacter sabulilitoris]|uniref:Sorbosone dehydrogenase family protein n=1 Tax=Mucilaginibacter sabulilitoris TaxID=1173583 RepID=A0ABZ0TSF2_9SPHI|nr:sorbosone dehydrogenase family protein [Mucilaginibacter sabulilitoris]WPU95078.1 sorbosone dehydrogenase family protein [Mucilaginibacter sabulilitoris]
MKIHVIYMLAASLLVTACKQKKPSNYNNADTVANKSDQQVKLDAPYATKAVKNYCEVIGWPKGKTPVAPEGFTVSLYADSLANPRNIYVAPNGDVFVSEANTEVTGIKKIGADIIGVSKSQNMGKSANKILLFKDTNGDGKPDSKIIFLAQLNQPFGILTLGDWFYVANTDGLWRYPYKAGDTTVSGKGVKILNLPAGGYNNHWTRNLRANKAGTKIYVSVGSGSNVAEHGMGNEKRRADILEINPDGGGERVYASGLRNPAGIDFMPGTDVLYTVVNERDNLGDNLVPDYLTSVKEGGFYGWPWAYFGQHEDPVRKGENPDMVKKTIVPDFALGAHTASLGLAFYNGKSFPQRYMNGAFIGQHGSWNSSKLVGYKVTFVPFENGKPTGKMEDFLTGFIADTAKGKVYGRPVGVAIAKDGSLLVADDSSNKIWQVKAK